MSPELQGKIKSAILLADGTKISSADPLFHFFIAQQEILDGFTQPVVEAVGAIPELLEKSLEKFVFAIEEAEKTSETLCAETKATLSALAMCELDSAHQRIKESVNSSVTSAVGDALQKVGADIAEMERKAKSLANGFRDPKALLLNLVLSSGLVVLLFVFSIGSFMLYQVGTKNLDSANFWHKQYQEQKTALSALPVSVKKQLPGALKVE